MVLAEVTGKGVRLVGRAPVAVGVCVMLWVVASVTDVVAGGLQRSGWPSIGLGVETVAEGRWWTMVAGLAWCSGVVACVGTTALLLGLVAPVEYRIGSVRTAVLMVITHVLGAEIGLGLAAVAAMAGSTWGKQLAMSVAAGPSTAAFGVALAASSRLAPLWRRRLRVGLLVALGVLALYSGSLQDILRLFAGTVGLLLGPFVLDRTASRARPQMVSAGETRTLVALAVAATAIGPVIAAASDAPAGPLSVLRYLVLAPVPDPAAVAAACAHPASLDDCVIMHHRLRLGGPGSAIMSGLPVLVLLVSAAGLRRGRWLAWSAALALNVGLAVLGAVPVVSTAASRVDRLAAVGGAADRQCGTELASVLAPLAIVALLWVTRARFRIRAPARAWRGPTFLATATLAATSAVYLVGSLLVGGQYLPAATWSTLLTDLPTRFLPPGYLGEVEIAFLPAGPVATVLYDWTGPTFWLVALGASWWLLGRTRTFPGDPDSARALLIHRGGSSLAWQTTWAGNSYWFTAKRDGAIAYRVSGRIALTCGEPFGDPDSRLAAVDGFARFCAEHGWTPCFYGVGETVLHRTRALGWDSVQVAAEAVLRLDGLTFTGKKWQDIRTAMNRAAHAGVTAQWIAFGTAPAALTEQIAAINEQWVADKGLPEMGFTLGGLEELVDDHVRCLVAVDADGVVHAVTSWLPIYEPRGTQAALVGWTLDVMRRRKAGSSAALRGLMEFLIASAVQTFQREGACVVSLSGTPLTRLGGDGCPDGLQQLLDRSAQALERVYGFGSLLAFKAKFQPQYRPLHMAFPDSAVFPAILMAITRSYLPGLGLSRSLYLLRHMWLGNR